VLVVLALAYLGWRWWKNRKTTPAFAASAEAEERIAATTGRDSKAIQKLASVPIWKSESTTTVRTTPPRKRPRAKPAAKRKAKRKAA
jgi:predicted negative regulator of RcsB-dependent stress response